MTTPDETHPIATTIDELNTRLRAQREKAITRICAIVHSGASRDEVGFIVDGLIMSVVLRDVGHMARGLDERDLCVAIGNIKAAGVAGA